MRAYLHGLWDLSREIYTRNAKENASQTARHSVSDYSFSHYLFGKMYQEGRHVERDDSVAYYWIRMAAEHGCAIAQYELGDIYQRGAGVYADRIAAYAWYTVAAIGGIANSARCREMLSEQMGADEKCAAQRMVTELQEKIATATHQQISPYTMEA